MRGQKRPKAEQARAVGLALITGTTEAAVQTGIPQRTIQDWMNSPEFASLRVTPREDVGETMWVAVQEGVYQLREGINNPKAYLRDKVAAFDSLVEKRALIMGEATTRQEIRSLDAYDDHEQEALRDAIDRELARRQAETDPAQAALETDRPYRTVTT